MLLRDYAGGQPEDRGWYQGDLGANNIFVTDGLMDSVSQNSDLDLGNVAKLDQFRLPNERWKGTEKWIHLVSFISNGLIEKLVDIFQIFMAVA